MQSETLSVRFKGVHNCRSHTISVLGRIHIDSLYDIGIECPNSNNVLRLLKNNGEFATRKFSREALGSVLLPKVRSKFSGIIGHVHQIFVDDLTATSSVFLPEFPNHND